MEIECEIRSTKISWNEVKGELQTAMSGALH